MDMKKETVDEQMFKNVQGRWPRVQIGKAIIDGIFLSILMQRLDAMVVSGKNHYVCFCEAHLCVRATKEADICNVLDKASLVLPDGVAMTLGSRLMGHRLPDRLPGPLVMLEYCKYGVSKGRKHFFYGGGEGIADKVSQKLKEKIPGLNVVGTFPPPFRPLTDEEEIDVKRMIEENGAEVLWVSLGAPKQERWMAEHFGKINVPLMLGVGAAFDFHSGNRKWAPVWIRKIGLEWMYRMFTGGKRVFLRNAKYDMLIMWVLAKQTITRVLRTFL
jgi:N-acetylglucosaminyldiphosphoundecaprenol N-acetyl-beta-D-mannosaminyltransferase